MSLSSHYRTRAITAIILYYSLISESHKINDVYQHPLLRSYDPSATLQKGRARIWKYEHDIRCEKSSAAALTTEGESTKSQNIEGSEIQFPVYTTSKTSANYQSSLLTKTDLNTDGVGGNELQCALQNQSPTRNYQPHPSFPAGHIHNRYRKTGTTIVGCIAENTLILAADTRATEGSIVADKLCEKVHCLAKNVWACGAGTSGDLDALVKKVRYNFLLKGLTENCVGNCNSNDGGEDVVEWFNNGSDEEQSIGIAFPNASISAICRYIRNELYSGGGEIGANLVLGGFDQSTHRAVLVAIHPHGSLDLVPYTALGSGGLAAMGVLESRFRSDMTVEEALKLVKDAVQAGIKNDLGSGSQVDISIISALGVQYIRGEIKEEELVHSEKDDNVAEDFYKRQISSENNNAVMDGVNGFGSLPYRIRSCRLIMENEENIKQARDKWLNSILKD